MVEADVTGVGRVWIKAAQTKNGEYRHAPFDDSLRDFVKNEIQQPLAEVHPKTIAEWEDGFRRDAEPEREIAIWCRLAERLVEFSKSEGLDKCNGGNVSQ